MSGVKLTDWQRKAAEHILSSNNGGSGAIMPYAELVVAADQLNEMGLAERRSTDNRRWLTPAGRLALSQGGEE